MLQLFENMIGIAIYNPICRESNDFLLPVIITFLNDRDWRVRADFFEHIGCLGASAGPSGLEAFLLPCLEQALADQEEIVVARALGFLTRVTEAGQLRKRALLLAAAKVFPALLLHVSTGVREQAVLFAAAAARHLSPGEAHTHLLPLLAPALIEEPVSLADVDSMVARLRRRDCPAEV